MLGLAMFLGVLIFWIALGIMIALVSGFSATNQLFQYPAITIIVGLIIGTMATGMFGFFSMRLPNVIYMINPEQNTLHGSFGLGILAAILSTPCTAPFMGAAAAWAATQAAATTLATFAAIGTGMALPYLVLSASPALVDKMPKTGPASVLIKQVMGLLFYRSWSGIALFYPAHPPKQNILVAGHVLQHSCRWLAGLSNTSDHNQSKIANAFYPGRPAGYRPVDLGRGAADRSGAD
jgi:thiol:disulfide interchange protein DsbD